MRLLLLLIMLAITAAGCKGGTVNSFRLEHDASSLQSLSADGAAMANSAAKGDTTDAFVRVHSSELAHAAGKLAKVLRSAHPQPRLRKETTRLIELTEHVGAILERLEHHPGDKQLARQVRKVCSNAAQRAEMLGASA
jgi:hypothetical protein